MDIIDSGFLFDYIRLEVRLWRDIVYIIIENNSFAGTGARLLEFTATFLINYRKLVYTW